MISGKIPSLLSERAHIAHEAVEFKHMPKSIALGPELKRRRTKTDRSVKAEVVRTWMGLSRFNAFFEQIDSHHVGAWVEKRSIYFELFVPMFGSGAKVNNAQQLSVRLATHAAGMKLALVRCSAVTLASVMHTGGREQHGCVFHVEFRDENNPF